MSDPARPGVGPGEPGAPVGARPLTGRTVGGVVGDAQRGEAEAPAPDPVGVEADKAEVPAADLGSASPPLPANAWLADGAGNRFVLLDDPEDRVLDAGDGPSLARTWCAGEVVPGFRPDGLLLLGAASADTAGRMVLFNADGSRPEACGNGLRCVALAAVRTGRVPAGAFRLATDSGVREVRVQVIDGAARVSVALGPARLVGEPFRVEGLDAQAVDVGNPHLVLLGEATGASEGSTGVLEDATVTSLGPRLATDARFPHGTNVEFVAPPTGPGAPARARVWERGVGETAACGTGAAAVAATLVARGLATWPVTVRLPGADLVLDLLAGASAEDAGVWLEGPTVLDEGPRTFAGPRGEGPDPVR